MFFSTSNLEGNRLIKDNLDALAQSVMHCNSCELLLLLMPPATKLFADNS